LTSAIAQAGTQPVQACEYKFGFTTAQAMVSTASVLENIGVSAYVLLPSLRSLITMLFLQLLTSSPRNSYLGAAPLITTASNLVVAAEIVTVEARHSTFIRVASNAIAVPSAFDTPLGIRSVFSLAAGFISSCPSGSNLAVTPFAAITMTAPSATEAIVAGTTIQLQTVSFVLLFSFLDPSFSTRSKLEICLIGCHE
jgi:hypothetical protein